MHLNVFSFDVCACVRARVCVRVCVCVMVPARFSVVPARFLRLANPLLLIGVPCFHA